MALTIAIAQMTGMALQVEGSQRVLYFERVVVDFSPFRSIRSISEHHLLNREERSAILFTLTRDSVRTYKCSLSDLSSSRLLDRFCSFSTSTIVSALVRLRYWPVRVDSSRVRSDDSTH